MSELETKPEKKEMTKSEIAWRKKHKDNIEQYEELYLAQEGKCSVCGAWDRVHWQYMVTPKTSIIPELVCLKCSLTICRSKFWKGGNS